ncbi:hypothetical protein BDR22DRAFT_845367 [Usnea florida]
MEKLTFFQAESEDTFHSFSTHSLIHSTLPPSLPSSPQFPLSRSRTLAGSGEFGKEVPATTRATRGTGAVDEKGAGVISDVLVARFSCVLGRRPIRLPGLRLGWFGVLARAEEFGKKVPVTTTATRRTGAVDEKGAGVVGDVLVARFGCVLGRRPVRLPGLRLGWFGILARAEEFGKGVCARAIVCAVNEQRAGVVADVPLARFCCALGRRPVCFPWLCFLYLGVAGRHSC